MPDLERRQVPGQGWTTVVARYLPSWWTEDSTPGSESVTFGGDVTIVPRDPASYGQTLDFSGTDEWAGAILVRVKDVSALAGGSVILRVVNEADATQTIGIDAWGGAQVKESVDGGSGSASWYWRAADDDVVFSILTGSKLLFSQGALEISPSDDTADPLAVRDSTGQALLVVGKDSTVGFFGGTGAVQQELDPSTCTAEDIADALIASTLMKAA